MQPLEQLQRHWLCAGYGLDDLLGVNDDDRLRPIESIIILRSPLGMSQIQQPL